MRNVHSHSVPIPYAAVVVRDAGGVRHAPSHNRPLRNVQLTVRDAQGCDDLNGGAMAGHWASLSRYTRRIISDPSWVLQPSASFTRIAICSSVSTGFLLLS